MNNLALFFLFMDDFSFEDEDFIETGLRDRDDDFIFRLFLPERKNEKSNLDHLCLVKASSLFSTFIDF